MSVLKWIVSAATVLALAGCGGGGGSAGDTPLDPDDPGNGGGTAVASLTVVLSSPTIPNTGTGSVTATVTALDANRNAVPDATVTVSAAAPAIAAVQGGAGSVTNASGQLLVTLTVPPSSANGPVVVTARANGASDATATLQIVDSPTGATPASVEIISSATAVGTGGDSVQLTAFVKDANNNALPATAVAFSATSGTLSSVSTSTNTAGAATATFAAGADRSNRSATVRVTAGTVTGTITLPITGTVLKVSGPSSLVLGNAATFDVVATDSNNNVLPNVTVTGSSSLGSSLTSTSTVTDADGQISFTYTPARAGTDKLTFTGGGFSVSPPDVVISGQDFAFVSPAASSTVNVGVAKTVTVRLRNNGVPVVGQAITFAATGGTLSPTTSVNTDANGQASVTLTSQSAGPVTVQASAVVSGNPVSATLPLTIVATNPSKLVLQVNPTAIAPTTGTAQVIAKVTDAAGNPVSGVTVNFTRVADPSGGNLQQASATTAENGQATVTYRAGGQSTADKGVQLKGEVASKPTVSGTASLTVNQASLFIALGTGNVIQNLNPQTYKKDWVVYVTDANGIPVDGATLTIKAIPQAYLTGQLSFVDPVWTYQAPVWSCPNEDADLDGVLKPSEDLNQDNVLWPGNVIAVTPGSVQTVDGVATISLIYAESYAPWVDIKLVASATVAGTESSTTAEFIVSGSAEDFSSKSVPPAGVVSPYGLLPNGDTTTLGCTRFR